MNTEKTRIILYGAVKVLDKNAGVMAVRPLSSPRSLYIVGPKGLTGYSLTTENEIVPSWKKTKNLMKRLDSRSAEVQNLVGYPEPKVWKAEPEPGDNIDNIGHEWRLTRIPHELAKLMFPNLD